MLVRSIGVFSLEKRVVNPAPAGVGSIANFGSVGSPTTGPAAGNLFIMYTKEALGYPRRENPNLERAEEMFFLLFWRLSWFRIG